MTTELNLGRPLKILGLDDEAQSIEIQENELKELEQNLASLEVDGLAVVSIMGAFRTGKSFILDMCLRYLRLVESGIMFNIEAENDEDVSTTPEWITAGGNRLWEGKDQNSSTGFHWRGGMDKCTDGIWVWSRPFIINVNSEKIAVLLMDTQGAWDSKLTKEHSATIFGLTAVLSSKQIYNISKQIQEDKIDNLAYFMNFAEAAIRQACDSDEKQKPFQELDFLVRDWPNYLEQWTQEERAKQMIEHQKVHLNDHSKNVTAKNLFSQFENIGTYMLPHPGLKVESPNWDGSISDIDPLFLKMADIYIRKIFSNVACKKFMGVSMPVSSFTNIVRSFTKSVGNYSLQATSFAEAMAVSSLLSAKDSGVKKFNDSANKILVENSAGLDESVIKELLKSLKTEVSDLFNSSAVFGSKEIRAHYYNDLVVDLKQKETDIIEKNRRMQEKVLARWATAAIIAIAIFILDKISDYTCDWWSPVCRKASRAAFTLYVTITAILLVQCVTIYRANGSLTTQLAVLELAKEILRKSQEMIQKVFKTRSN